MRVAAARKRARARGRLCEGGCAGAHGSGWSGAHASHVVDVPLRIGCAHIVCPRANASQPMHGTCQAARIAATNSTSKQHNKRTNTANKQTSEQTNRCRSQTDTPQAADCLHAQPRDAHSHATGHAAWREPANQRRCARPTPYHICTGTGPNPHHICTGTLTRGGRRRAATWRRVGVKLGHDAEDLKTKRTRPSAASARRRLRH